MAFNCLIEHKKISGKQQLFLMGQQQGKIAKQGFLQEALTFGF
jgi:hypothetical protein